MNSTLSNIIYNSIAKVITMGVGLATATILQRNLGPEDYGVVGVAMIIIGFLGQFNDLGMGAALVQRKNADASTLETAQTLNLILSGILFLCALLAAPFTAKIFKNQSVPAVVAVLSVTFLLSAVGFLPSSLLAREMQFGKLRMPSVVGSLLRGVVAVGCALAGLKYWSLVVGTLTATLATAVLLNLVHPVRAKWRMHRDIARELLHFGLPLVASGILVFMVFNVDNFVIGLFQGSGQLGYYAVAFTWATFVASTLYEIVHSVLFSRFSKSQNDRRALADMYYRSLHIVMFGAVMVNAVLFAVSDGFLITVLGKGTHRWAPAIPLLQILCVYGILRAIMEPIGNVILALGRTRLLLWANLMCVVLEISLLPIVVRRWGLTGVAFLVLVIYNLQWFIYGPFVKRELGIGFFKLVKLALPVFVAGVLGVLASRAIAIENPISWTGIIVRASTVCLVFILVHSLLTRAAVIKETLLILKLRMERVQS